MRRLQGKLAQEFAWPALLVSSTFALPATAADEVVRVTDLYHTPVYVYRRIAQG